MRTEDLKDKIVLLVGNSEFYGYEIHKILESQGIKIEISRLYRVLNEMLKNNFFSSRWEKSSSGPKKRVYKLDKRGIKKREEQLLEAIATVHKFYGEYLQSLPAELNIFDKIVNYFKIRELETKKIGLLTHKRSKIVEVFIKKIHQKTSISSIYLIKPDSISFNINLKNLFLVEGNFSTIPFKDDYLDLLIVLGIPEKDLFIESLKEWARSVEANGKLIIIAPTVLIDDYNDPKNIGEFFEEFEHYESKKINKIGTDTVLKNLKELFVNVEKTNIVHLSLFRASKCIC